MRSDIYVMLNKLSLVMLGDEPHHLSIKENSLLKNLVSTTGDPVQILLRRCKKVTSDFELDIEFSRYFCSSITYNWLVQI